MAAVDYASRLEPLAPHLPGAQLGWLSALRAEALADFRARGFPTTREEEWRYTNLASIERKAYAPISAPAVSAGVDLSGYLLADAYRLVFVDGRLAPESCRLPDVAGVRVSGLAQALAGGAGDVQAWLGGALAEERHGLIRFNTACFGDGALVHLAAGCRLDRPLQLVFFGATADALMALRNLIVLEAGAQAEIVETYAGSADVAYFTAAVNEVTLEEGASLTLSKLQVEGAKATHFGGTYARVGRHALFQHHNFAFGAALARSEVHADLAQASDCQLNGLFLAQGQQHLDQHIRVEHRETDATSRETYKGILDGRSRGVFQGRVVVRPDAQRSDAAMSNRNLLLSADAEIDTKPQLEIYADDVKCAHGVTIGQLDEESVFFLKSRGLDEAGARALLTFAFANERVDAIENLELCAQVRAQLLARFPGAGIEKDWL